jgi:nucleotide-binding universal stress UspA family protein
MENTKKILAVSWLTKYCHSVIHKAVSLASKYDAELTVIHIVDTLWYQGWNLPMVSQAQERKKDMDKIKGELDSFIDSEISKGVKIKAVVREGEPSEEILKFIKEENIDLVVLRAHAEGRLERILIGDSNDVIFRKMPCSIFLLKN